MSANLSLSEISIKKPVFAWMLMMGLIVFGALAFQRMGISQLPDVDFPVVSVSVALSGASPEVMEMDVIDPLESAIMGVEGVTNISSTAKTGSASITVQFDISKDIDLAIQDIQTVISKAVRSLPKEIDAPSVSKTNPEDQPILWATVSSPTLSRPELMALVKNRIQDRFTTIEGVGEVSVGGYLDPNLRVWVSSKKLDAKELTVTDVLNAITMEHSEKPSGRIEAENQEFNIRTMGEVSSVEDFGNIMINRRGGSANYRPVRLKEIATVEDSTEDMRKMSRVTGGTPAVGLGIKKQRGSNAVEVAKAVKARIAELQKELPSGVEIGVRFDTTKFIEESIKELNFTLFLSALLTALVCWFFLGSFSATINVILAIPTSIIGSFIVLYALGFTLNSFTLLGLSLAIGIVVDDAIMVLENIVRHREKGEGRKQAALRGTREITLAAMAATAAIVAIFLPVAFMDGIIGKFFFQFGVTISVAVLLSLLEALTLTPMRCSEFLNVSPRTSFIGRGMEGAFHSLANGYQKIIPLILRHRVITLFMALMIFASSLLLIKNIKKEFVPPQEQAMLMLRLSAPVGSSLDFTDKKVFEVEAKLKETPEIKDYFVTIGGKNVNDGMIFVSLKPVSERPIDSETGHKLSQQDLVPRLKDKFSTIEKMKVVVQDPSTIGFASKRGLPVEFSVKGPNWDELVVQSKKIMERLEKEAFLTDIDSDYKDGMPEIQVIPDREKAQKYGVGIGDIGTTINALMGGVIAGKFSSNGHRNDIRVRLMGEERTTPEDIIKLKVRNNRGELIPLSELVTLKTGEGLQSISRDNRERAITIAANLAPKVSQDTALVNIETIGKEILPENYHLSLGGNSQNFKDSFKSLIFALLLGLVVAYMVLASQFNSFIHPFTVLIALPFSVSGALVALVLTGQSMNIYSMIGMILLMGLVKKNSILLVDFTNQMREEGSKDGNTISVNEAILKACPVRIRPIIMTSTATIMGAIPPALSFGPGAETRIPMAITILGGVILSTFLTLLVVPAVYSLFSHLERKTKLS